MRNNVSSQNLEKTLLVTEVESGSHSIISHFVSRYLLHSEHNSVKNNQNIFVGFLEKLKKIVVKNWIWSKIAFISFGGRMLKSKNLKMGTSSKARFTLTERLVSILQRQTF